MKTKTKILIGAGFLLLLPILFITIIFGIGIFVGSDEKYIQAHSAAMAEGREFGAATDQQGCLEAGLWRNKSKEISSITDQTVNGAFVEQCLKASRPTPGFCGKVPTVLGYREWGNDQCRLIGRADEDWCITVYDVKHTVCN